MNAVLEFLRKVFNGIVFLFQYDLQNFKNTFHNTYWLLFFTMRLLPWLVAIIFFTNLVRKKRKQIKLAFEALKRVLDMIGNCPPKILFLLIFLLAAVLRIWYALALPLIPAEGDAISRLQQAKEWYDTYNGVPGNLVWLPLHHWIIGFGSLFGLDILYSSRFITLLFSLLTFPVFYSLINRKFGSSVALISCFILAVNPFHIKYSVITMSEIPFIFFALSALLALFKFIESEKKSDLFISVFCLSCCSLIRFEGWILSALAPLILFYYKRNLKSFLLFGALNSLVILGYMVVSLANTGRLIEGLYISDLTVKNTFALQQNPGTYILENLRYGLVLPVWIPVVLLYGIYLAIKEKKELPWLALSLILIAMTAWKMFNHTSEPFWRYLSTGLFLILPFASYGLYRLIKMSRPVKVLWLPLVFIASSLNIYGQYKYIIDTRNVPEGFYETAKWFKAHRQPGQLFIYHSARDYAPFLILSNTTSDDVYHPDPPEMKVYKRYRDFTDTLLLQKLTSRKYSFLIYQANSKMDSVFHQPDVQEEIKKYGVTTDSVYGNINYRIWSLKN